MEDGYRLFYEDHQPTINRIRNGKQSASFTLGQKILKLRDEQGKTRREVSA